MTPWFGPKRQGYGIGPRGWQGWLVTALFLAGLFADKEFFQPETFSLPVWTKPALAITLGLGFLGLIWLKYDGEDAD